MQSEQKQTLQRLHITTYAVHRFESFNIELIFPTGPSGRYSPESRHSVSPSDASTAETPRLGGDQGIPASPLTTAADYYDTDMRTLLLRTRRINPYIFLRRGNQYEFLVLASLTWDILSIPATGSTPNRLFSTARDFCTTEVGPSNP